MITARGGTWRLVSFGPFPFNLVFYWPFDCGGTILTDKILPPAGVWRNREDAFNGGRGPWHRKARGAAREMYEEITFHTHRFIIGDGAFEWTLEDFVE